LRAALSTPHVLRNPVDEKQFGEGCRIHLQNSPYRRGMGLVWGRVYGAPWLAPASHFRDPPGPITPSLFQGNCWGLGWDFPLPPLLPPAVGSLLPLLLTPALEALASALSVKPVPSISHAGNGLQGQHRGQSLPLPEVPLPYPPYLSPYLFIFSFFDSNFFGSPGTPQLWVRGWVSAGLPLAPPFRGFKSAGGKRGTW